MSQKMPPAAGLMAPAANGIVIRSPSVGARCFFSSEAALQEIVRPKRPLAVLNFTIDSHLKQAAGNRV